MGGAALQGGLSGALAGGLLQGSSSVVAGVDDLSCRVGKEGMAEVEVRATCEDEAQRGGIAAVRESQGPERADALFGDPLFDKKANRERC